MLELEEIRTRLEDRNMSAVARATGLSIQTVWRIKTGQANNITLDTLKKLSDYFEARR